ncbi:MarR family transcriptional regulator [Oxalobacteraceae bacterium OM1]|nr:MarR family transcriptional regulator [Oxalobacteraceae bacterium OM1]
MDALGFCLDVFAAHASLTLKLDDELGTYHGLGLRDFAFLHQLSVSPVRPVPLTVLVRPMGMPKSGLARELLRLEKIGLVQRSRLPDGAFAIDLCPAGARMYQEALATAAQVCGAAVPTATPSVLRLAGGLLAELGAAPALQV